MDRSNQSANSPYSTTIQQYPSQSSDYLSLHVTSSRIQQEPQQQPNHWRQQQPYNQQRNNTTAARFDNFADGERNFPAFRSRRGGGRGGGHNRYFGGLNNDNYGASGTGRGNYHTNYARDQQHQHLNRWAHDRGGNFATGRGGRGMRTAQRPTIGKDEMYTMYFHPSMLEDPWKKLMERHNAIHNSEISLQSIDDPKAQEDAMDSNDDDQDVSETADGKSRILP